MARPASYSKESASRMHTLEQLERGELTGIRRLDLSADLQHFPEAIFALADTLEVLNLSGNRLNSLPSDLSRLRKLRILFCSDNLFTEVPGCLGGCEQLEMIGFKANQIRHLPGAALPPALRWLILTDNQLQALPDEIGNCRHLQKLMLAGNQLSSLPDTLANCVNLELLRVAANRLPALPDWLLTLPRLSWLAAAGNPFSDASEAMSLARHSLPAIPREQVVLHEQLGQGASGIIYRAAWQPSGQSPKQMAAKLFKGHVTSDGLPHSEMAACVSAGAHRNLIDVAGPLADQPGQTPGLLMDLVEPAFQPLAVRRRWSVAHAIATPRIEPSPWSRRCASPAAPPRRSLTCISAASCMAICTPIICWSTQRANACSAISALPRSSSRTVPLAKRCNASNRALSVVYWKSCCNAVQTSKTIRIGTICSSYRISAYQSSQKAVQTSVSCTPLSPRSDALSGATPQ